MVPILLLGLIVVLWQGIADSLASGTGFGIPFQRLEAGFLEMPGAILIGVISSWMCFIAFPIKAAARVNDCLDTSMAPIGVQWGKPSVPY